MRLVQCLYCTVSVAIQNTANGSATYIVHVHVLLPRAYKRREGMQL